MWFTKIDDMRGALITPANQVTRTFVGAHVTPVELSCDDDPRICCVEWVELRGSVATLVRLPAAELPAWALNLYAPRPVIQRAKPRRPPLFAKLRALIAGFLRPAPIPPMSADMLNNLAWVLARAGRDVRNGATARGGAHLSLEDDGEHILVDVRVVK
jgi:hypothetical protein